VLPRHLSRASDGRLLLEGNCLETLVSGCGTPAYLISAAALRQSAKQVRDVVQTYCPNALVSFAYKANALPTVCSILHSAGIGAEVGSLMELKQALELGVGSDVIVFNGPLKSDQALDLALNADVRYLNADSLSELKRIDNIAAQRGQVALVGLRVAPTVTRNFHGRTSRFGVDCADGRAIACLREAAELPSVQITGIQFHLGTQIGSVEPFNRAVSETIEIMSQGLDEGLLQPGYLDIGGGFAVAPSTVRRDLEDYACAQICEDLLERVLELSMNALDRLDPRLRLVIEPGRLMVARAAVLATRVMDRLSHKETIGFVVDAGQNMVSSNLNTGNFHDVVPVKQPAMSDEIATNLFGCLCYETDIIALGLPLPALSSGDLLTILDCGAYDISLVSPFIVPRPPVFLVDGDTFTCVRSDTCFPLPGV
jgi:diaminopimelate decarboxylase